MMTTDQSLLNESRLMLERWVSYYDKQGHSTDLLKDTKALIARIPPEPDNYIAFEKGHRAFRVCLARGIEQEKIDSLLGNGFRIIEGLKFGNREQASEWVNEIHNYQTNSPRYLPTDDEVARMERNGEG